MRMPTDPAGSATASVAASATGPAAPAPSATGSPLGRRSVLAAAAGAGAAPNLPEPPVDPLTLTG
ncbi:hypothetical protein [Streptomyces sp. NPDC001282]|uniref:hypothetical protein n=1 Tax=Streptomyces sp. NPDC001282 TaxID=3364557 RepID=UPI0036B4A52B